MEVPEERTVEEVMEKLLEVRNNEEKEWNRRRNKIVFELPESKKPEPEDRKEGDIKKFTVLCKSIMMITFDQGITEHAIEWEINSW